ncbi:MAG: hypothetical protein ACRDFS_05630 [Chloroflexota bacterium]
MLPDPLRHTLPIALPATPGGAKGWFQTGCTAQGEQVWERSFALRASGENVRVLVIVGPDGPRRTVYSVREGADGPVMRVPLRVRWQTRLFRRGFRPLR